MLLVVLHQNESADQAEMIHYLDGKIANWCKPDHVVFVDELPHTATGKLDKKVLRGEYTDMRQFEAEAV